jgi:hypothetical protein
MKLESIITWLGVSMLITFCIIQIFNFYGIGINVYGSYIAFYCFLLISTFVLPTNYPSFIS